MKLTRACQPVWQTAPTAPLKRAWLRFLRDLEMTLLPADNEEIKPARVILDFATDAPESYQVSIDGGQIKITGADELGIIYGLLFISERFLGISPLWYWNDQVFNRREYVEIPAGTYLSPAYAIRYRGWFINDEVLLDAWGQERINPDSGFAENDAWEMAMEALLRLGGNLVIPGTDHNSHKYRQMAADMGLWITHHHAEPLGAKMFARTYPDLVPSYDTYPERFHQLWQEAIEEQKETKTIWNLGFRGQGDKPFWDDDPSYDTPKKRGELISSLIFKQYEEVAKQVENPVCCTNLYGEVMELYQQGYITLPENVIYIWADNGYGKMVSRRQGNHNPRVPALPKAAGGRHGIYYHASFYDLQAASHMTMLPNGPAFVKAELEEAMAKGVRDFWVVNCSNVKPHTYMLDVIARIWGKEMAPYETLYFANQHQRVAALYQGYFQAMLKYGPNEDDHAGDQFYHYTMRDICYWWALGRTGYMDNLRWLTGEARDFGQQIGHVKEIVVQGLGRLKGFYEACALAAAQMESQLLKDSLELQAAIHYHSACALLKLCNAFALYQDERLEEAFYAVGETVELIRQILVRMKVAEHGKWQDFYANDCLTDIKFTIYSLEKQMGYLRALGDGPHYYGWALKYCYEMADHRVVLITNMRNHPGDWEVYKGMKRKK